MGPQTVGQSDLLDHDVRRFAFIDHPHHGVVNVRDTVTIISQQLVDSVGPANRFGVTQYQVFRHRFQSTHSIE